MDVLPLDHGSSATALHRPHLPLFDTFAVSLTQQTICPHSVLLCSLGPQVLVPSPDCLWALLGWQPFLALPPPEPPVSRADSVRSHLTSLRTKKHPQVSSRHVKPSWWCFCLFLFVASLFQRTPLVKSCSHLISFLLTAAACQAQSQW